MRYCLIIFIVISSLSLFSQNNDNDSSITEILAMEKEATSPFLLIRSFHLGLESETGFSIEYPYDSLKVYFSAMKNYADSAILCRMAFQENEIRHLTQTQEQMTRFIDHAKINSDHYHRLLLLHQIKKVDAFEMIEIVGKALFENEEMMVAQGRVVAEMKLKLNATIDRKTQKDHYAAAYRPISSAESIFKQTQAYIVQLENLYSRFESSNGESVYYFGPQIKAQPEQEAFQLTIDLLEVGQSEFEMYTSDFEKIIGN